MSLPEKKMNIVVLISGSGTNLQALIDANIPQSEIVAVISNRPLAKGLQRAIDANIKTQVLDHTDFNDRETFDASLMTVIDSYQPDLIVLAGYMRILTHQFVNHYQNRMLNIHPSLLPLYKGLNTHQRAIDAGDKEHGCSVHFVTETLDDGPVVLQATVPVKDSDDAVSLAARVQIQEHIIYPLVISWLAEGRLYFKQDNLMFNDKPLKTPVQLDQLPPSERYV